MFAHLLLCSFSLLSLVPRPKLRKSCCQSKLVLSTSINLTEKTHHRHARGQTNQDNTLLVETFPWDPSFLSC